MPKQTDSVASRIKTEIDVEMALRWAWRDELSKRQTSAAEGVWDRINDFGRRGGVDVDDGDGSSQRYAHFGLPDPDAERLEQAVANLEPVVIDWSLSLDQIAGPLAGLVSVNDFKPKQPRTPKFGWGKAGDRALRGFFGPGGERPLRDRPRDIMMIGTFHPKTLVTVCAAGGKRPDWRDEEPKPQRMLSANGKEMIEGKCEGRNRYSLGAYCPLDWQPSPTTVILARADYAVWWEALSQLAATVGLEKFILLPPSAPAAPWFGEVDGGGEVIPVAPNEPMVHLPLAPRRGRMLSPYRHPHAGPVRHVYSKTSAEAGQ